MSTSNENRSNVQIESEARLSFIEATSIIIGHGVGAGILAVPYLASRNTWWDFLWILALAYAINLILHLMIAELSLNNGGLQFVKCFENELFKGLKGKAGKIFTWIIFIFLGFSVLCNIASFITGASAVFSNWFGLPAWAGMLIYYVIAGLVVFFGMKFVGICEKYSIFAMIAVIGVLFVATLRSQISPLPVKFIVPTNLMALYSTVAFSLSAVMSVPQVVKGVNGDKRKIVGAIAAGTGINTALIVIVTFMTLIGAGTAITKQGALVDLSVHLGGWVSIVGYIFTLLALSTSFWANSLNMRDIISEQTKWNLKICWLLATLPCLVLALCSFLPFVTFARLAGVIQVLTGIGIIVAYNRSRKRTGCSSICGKWGTLPFQILVIIGSIIATVGSVFPIK
ncbi:MAG: aromatic amino acid transport family protein [Treponemataceae bacterium]